MQLSFGRSQVYSLQLGTKLFVTSVYHEITTNNLLLPLSTY